MFTGNLIKGDFSTMRQSVMTVTDGDYLKHAETPAQLADDASLLQNLAHGGHRRLLLGLHAAARHDPVVRPPRRRHQQNLRTDATLPTHYFTIIYHDLYTNTNKHYTKANIEHGNPSTNLRFGIRTHADTCRTASKSLVVVYPNWIRLLLHHLKNTRKHERNRRITNEKLTSNIKKTMNRTKFFNDQQTP